MGPETKVQCVLFDRDGTVVVDVPYNGDPALVELVPGAAAAVASVRDAAVPVALISNQSGVARRLITRAQVDAVNERLEELLGVRFDHIAICPHGPDDGCACRKPRPGMIFEAADALGIDAARCVMIGDIGADVEAAKAAGARGILVPTPVTRPEEVAAADEVVGDLAEAVRLALETEQVAAA
jgi:D-glycero-D-manno-heptose 1,7-bisphosphate phosphatase